MNGLEQLLAHRTCEKAYRRNIYVKNIYISWDATSIYISE